MGMKTDIKFSCGPVRSESLDVPSFNDLASVRDRSLDQKIGLCRAVELIQAIGADQRNKARTGHTEATPRLVVDESSDLPCDWDRTIVAMLLEPVGASLVVGGETISADDADDAAAVAALRMFASVQVGAALAFDVAHAAAYLCGQLGLTGRQAAWAVNTATGAQRYNAKNMLYYAAQDSRATLSIRTVIGDADDLIEETTDLEALFSRPNLHFFISPGLQVAAAVRKPSNELHYALALYQPPGAPPANLPDDWGTPTLRTKSRMRIQHAMAVMNKVPYRGYAATTLPTTSREHARRYADRLREHGASTQSIAESLNREGYRVTRGGIWHRRAVSDLLRLSKGVGR